MNKSKEKTVQLGMSYGKANAILRKSILFSLVKKCNLDNCYRCNKKIEKIEELSIEHKIPWLHSEQAIELFFDLDNISFSHLSCNSSHSRINIKACKESGALSHKDKIAPNGMSWCGRCKQFKNKEYFSYNKHTRSKTEWICKVCRKEIRNKI